MATVLERPRIYAPVSFGGGASPYIIESGIPVPPVTYNFTGREAIYPFAHMRVGDSFEVGTSDYKARNGRLVTPAKLQSNVGNCARGYAKTHNPTAKFTTRKISDTAIRVWRIACPPPDGGRQPPRPPRG